MTGEPLRANERMAKFKVVIDEAKCIGAGQCVLTAPALFDQRDSDGVVVLLNAEPDSAQHEAARRAVALCPSSAIWIEEQ